MVFANASAGIEADYHTDLARGSTQRGRPALVHARSDERRTSSATMRALVAPVPHLDARSPVIGLSASSATQGRSCRRRRDAAVPAAPRPEERSESGVSDPCFVVPEAGDAGVDPLPVADGGVVARHFLRVAYLAGQRLLDWVRGRVVIAEELATAFAPAETSRRVHSPPVGAVSLRTLAVRNLSSGLNECLGFRSAPVNTTVPPAWDGGSTGSVASP